MMLKLALAATCLQCVNFMFAFAEIPDAVGSILHGSHCTIIFWTISADLIKVLHVYFHLKLLGIEIQLMCFQSMLLKVETSAASNELQKTPTTVVLTDEFDPSDFIKSSSCYVGISRPENVSTEYQNSANLV